ncbi:MAG: retron system putative HNH endonuclease [Steroidobacteraceae bacterium]
MFTRQTVSAGGKKITRAASELAKAIDFFTDPNNYRNEQKLTRKFFNFKVYKDKELMAELEKIFGNKCAYCESSFAHVTPKDIEHYRPKSAVDVKGSPSRTPGYFWLASDWTNLLVSCPDCNRSREHEVPGQTAKVLLGKQAQFPLSDEAKRVRRHKGDVKTEEPARLLLDPCADDPDEFLTFDDRGLIHPRVDAAGKAKEKGKVSIDVCALQRKGLVEARLRVINDVIFQFEQLLIAAVELGTLKAEGAADARIEGKRDQLRRIRLHLATRTAADAPFLGMVRGYIRRTKAAGGFDDLIRAGIDPENLLTV